MRFAGRLVLGMVLVLVVTAGVLVILAEVSLRRDLEADFARSLEREARLIAQGLPQDSTRWAEAVRAYSRGSEHRVTLIRRDGTVSTDSDFPPTQVSRLENHGDRPEVRIALRGGVGRARRPSTSLGQDLMYLAVPGGPGVVRVAAGLEQVDLPVRHAQRALLAAALLAVLIGSVLALLSGRAIAQPLTQLAGAARAIAAGNVPRFPRSGVADIDALVRALRQMNATLGERFDALRREQAAMTALVDSMEEGVLAADSRGRIITANAAARRMLGYDAAAPLPELEYLFRSKSAREVVAAAMAGQVVRGRELELNGQVLAASARPLAEDGVVLVLYDLTEIRRLETVRRDFVANVSHELKTPLTAISGYTETLLGEKPDRATESRFLEVILSNARRMQRLVDSLLDLSRIEGGRWQLRKEPVHLGSAAQEAWEGLGDQSARRSVQFAVEPAPDAETLNADPDAIRQILTNLLDNAARYTPAGGRIVVRSVARDGGVELVVADTGPGIGQEHLPRIFERFYRADPSRSRDAGGTGLGLAIVKHLVEAHGGRVAAVSEPGRGLEIHCWFPPGGSAEIS